MDPRSLDRFRRSVSLFGAAPIVKVARSPRRMIYSMAVEKLCSRRCRAIHSTASTFWGGRMNVVLPEPMSTSIYRYGFIEEGLTWTFLSLLRPGMTVFDVGAHFGYFSLLAASLVGETGAVHSFEPTPSTFQVLRSNVGRLSNVTVNNCAVFSRDAQMQFEDFGVEFSAFNSLRGGRLDASIRQQLKPATCTVQAISLDGYIQKLGIVPDLIKIDAENAEQDILLGLQATLGTDKRPMITLEVGEDVVQEGQSANSVAYLLDRGYSAFQYDTQTESLREHKLQSAYGYDNLLMVPPERRAGLQLGSS
jgi:FkbM family methyltransferase